jgi:hypothetical protein
METITASLATIPRRTKALKEMVDSILPQVDILQVYLNGFEEKDIPVFLMKENKVRLYQSQKEAFGDRGDAGKFFNVQNIGGWHFICDDDIHYPEDYVKKMIETCDKYGRQYVIGNHGGDFSKFPIQDSYKDRKRTVHYKKSRLEQDIAVHYLATNSLCFHDDTIKLNDDKHFRIGNMGDIWLAVACQEQDVGMVVRAHDWCWINDCENYDKWDSIYGHRYKDVEGNATVQTGVANTVKNWEHKIDTEMYSYLLDYKHEKMGK